MYCEFTQSGDKGALILGYQKRTEKYGEWVDVPKIRCFFDHLGNVYDEADAQSSSKNITHYCDLEVAFFAPLLSVLKDSLKQEG